MSIRGNTFGHRTLLLTLTALLAGCQLSVRYQIDGKLNPNPLGEATDLVVIPFFVTENTREDFAKLTYDQLEQEREKPVPGRVATELQTIRATVDEYSKDAHQPYSGRLLLSQPSGTFQHLGLAANFYIKSGKNCCLVVPLSELDSHTVVIDANGLSWQPRH